jgi:hypothetical protein
MGRQAGGISSTHPCPSKEGSGADGVENEIRGYKAKKASGLAARPGYAASGSAWTVSAPAI